MTTAEGLTPRSVYSWPFHPQAAFCPVCKKDCKHEALVNLLYVFEECSCLDRPSPHLVEQLYHRKCYEDRLLKRIK